MFFNKNKKTKLSLGNPKVCTYHYDAYPLSVISSGKGNYNEWIMSNYIQLCANKNIKNSDGVFLEFYGEHGFSSPFLEVQKLSWKFLSKMGINLHNVVEKVIEEGYYIYVQVDEYFIPKRWAYNNTHYLHDLLIYGYDKSKGQYNVVGYDDKFNYVESVISYTEFYNGFVNNFYDLELDENYWADRIFIFKYNMNGKYDFNINLVKKTISDYVNSRNDFELYNRFKNSNENKVYGVQIYDKVLEYLESIEKEQILKLDLRIFKLLEEHKILMIERLLYMRDRGLELEQEVEKYYDIDRLAKQCKIFAMKYNVMNSKKILELISSSLKIMKEKEIEVLKNVLLTI